MQETVFVSILTVVWWYTTEKVLELIFSSKLRN